MTENRSTLQHSINRQRTPLRRTALLLSALAVISMGGVTVACSPRSEKPAETVKVPETAPTEKSVRTNVTRSPMVAVPPGSGSGNAAVPCGFGPAGGAPCGNNG